MITKYEHFSNESVRDKMTPKSQKDIENIVKDILSRVTASLTMYPMKINPVFNKISNLFGEHRSDLFMIDEEDDGYNTIDMYFQDLTKDKEKVEFETDLGYYDCYPNEQLCFFSPDDMEFPSFWVFCKKNFMIIESVRDMMTPKSDDDIRQYVSTLTQEEKNKKLLEFSLKHYKNWVKVLLDEGADPNYIMHKDGNTLIFRVIVGGITSSPDLDIVRMLLEAGADPTVPNVRGIDTLKYCKQWKKWDIVELIEPYYNKGVNESIRDRMTPKPEGQALEEFKKLDKSDMVSSLYSECIEMFDPNPPMDSTPVVTDSFCDFLKKEVGFDVFTTFLPQFRKYINYDMVLDDLTEEQLIKLFKSMYEIKMNESV